MLIGREKEYNNLNSIYTSEKAEFVAIYGRRE
jgi:AAA+ ATPase superfamily predicted ATPase